MAGLRDRNDPAYDANSPDMTFHGIHEEVAISSPALILSITSTP